MDSLILVKHCPPSLWPGARTLVRLRGCLSEMYADVGGSFQRIVGLLVSSTVFDNLLWDLAISARSSDDTDEC